jgi:hypothetical protein
MREITNEGHCGPLIKKSRFSVSFSREMKVQYEAKATTGTNEPTSANTEPTKAGL